MTRWAVSRSGCPTRARRERPLAAARASTRKGSVRRLAVAPFALALVALAPADSRLPSASGGTVLSTPSAGLWACPTADPQRVLLKATSSTGGGSGYVELTMATSPFGVSVSPAGHYLFDLKVAVQQLRRRPGLSYVVWVATPELDRVRKLGVLGEGGVVSGQVDWNKFLVFVTAETSTEVSTWKGPILLTALSPSGLMHTMRGHGIFEAHGIGC
ncbi:MAG: hypothetical protein ACE5HP_00980 [Gemmatimonadota bacterium]